MARASPDQSLRRNSFGSGGPRRWLLDLFSSIWFGMGLLVLEGLARRTPFRNLFALGSAVASTVALMAAYFLPAGLDSSISNKMAALNDVWLYIHTNVIIASYALIALFHVRLKVRDKAFWTAVLAVFGFEVMMFNWIIINFIVVGLHSYA